MANGSHKNPDFATLTAAEWAEKTGKMGGLARAKKLTAAQRKAIAQRAAQARWAKTEDATPPTTPQPTLRGRKVSTSDKRGRVGILSSSRCQLRLPLSIAAAVLAVFSLTLVCPVPLHASNPAFVVGVRGASPEASFEMPAKTTLRRVVHRKPVPYMPHAHVPKYLLVYVVETLECGHRVTVYPQADALIAVRRRCQDCDGGEVVPINSAKKPSVSVSFSNQQRKGA